jgi:hypothetical protein
MNLSRISNEQLVAHYRSLGILSEWEWVKNLIGRVWGDSLVVLIDANLRAKKWKQPALSLNYNGGVISDPREALERANRTITRILESPSDITKIQSISGGSFTWEHGRIFVLPKNITAKVGDQVLYYGEWIGWPVRGLVIDGVEAFYETKDEQDIADNAWRRKKMKEQKMRFKEQKEKLDSDYLNLPPEFQARIDRLRSENPNFRIESEAREMFCCKQSIALIPYFQTLKKQSEDMRLEAAMNSTSFTVIEAVLSFEDKIQEFMNLSFEEQKRLIPSIYDWHSGNTFGWACKLAYAYIEWKPV